MRRKNLQAMRPKADAFLNMSGNGCGYSTTGVVDAQHLWSSVVLADVLPEPLNPK